MRKILPFIFWQNGQNLTAIYLYLNCSYDNLQDQAVFYWAFYDEAFDVNNVAMPGNRINQGNITMTGTDYDNWDSNDYAYNWAAGVLGVTFAP